MRFIKIFFTLILIAVVCVSGYMVEKKLNEYRIAKQLVVTTSQEVRKGRTVDFDKLKKRNPDVKAWIMLPGTPIDYPVLQAKDNDYYLHRDIDGNYLYDGSIFIDAYNKDPFRDYNTIVYGHRMASGAMFHELSEFQDEEYFDSHRIFQLEMPGGESKDILALAFLNEPPDSPLYRSGFSQEEGFAEAHVMEGEESDAREMDTREDFVNLVKEKAEVLRDPDLLTTSGQYVTLSTCAYNYEDARIQVIGKIQEAETKTVEHKSFQDKHPSLNIWLLLQILTALVVLLATVAMIINLIPPKKSGERK